MPAGTRLKGDTLKLEVYDLYKRANEYLNGLRKNSDEQSRKILSEYNIILQEQSKAYTQKINEETEGLESKLSSIGNFTITLQQVKEELDLYLNDVKKQISSIEEQERLFAVIITINTSVNFYR